MKPTIMKRMAESLNYKAEPNWLTYCKVRELADRVELELPNQALNPNSRIDVQDSFGRQSELGDGKYGSTDSLLPDTSVGLAARPRPVTCHRSLLKCPAASTSKNYNHRDQSRMA